MLGLVMEMWLILFDTITTAIRRTSPRTIKFIISISSSSELTSRMRLSQSISWYRCRLNEDPYHLRAYAYYAYSDECHHSLLLNTKKYCQFPYHPFCFGRSLGKDQRLKTRGPERPGPKGQGPLLSDSSDSLKTLDLVPESIL